MKVCKGCGITKLLDEFPRHKAMKDGHLNFCKDCKSEYRKQWGKQHPGYEREHARKWQASNRERYRENLRNWVHNNLSKVAHWNRQKRAKRHAAFVEEVCLSVVAERDQNTCGICGCIVKPGEESLDHIWPISKGGEHSYRNTQLAHRSCNTIKGNRSGFGNIQPYLFWEQAST